MKHDPMNSGCTECGQEREIEWLEKKVSELREALLQWKYYWDDPRGLEDARAIKANFMTDAALKETEP